MKVFYLSIIAVLALNVSLHAQTTQPAAPADTVFPLGGLNSCCLNGSVAGSELSKFGLNMFYNLSPGIYGISVDPSVDLNYFFPQGTNANPPTGGYNPLFAELDCDLVSNEHGDAAWDLASSATGISTLKFWATAAPGDPLKGNNEYYIDPPGPNIGIQNPSDDPLSPNDPNVYYLWDFNQHTDGTEIFDPGTYIGVVGSPENPTPATTFYIDFIYRLDPTDYPSSPTTVYNLLCNLQTTGGSATITYSADDGAHWLTPTTGNAPVAGTSIIPINYTDTHADPTHFQSYLDYIGVDASNPVPDTARDFALHPTENLNYLRFPNRSLSPPFPLSNYKPQPYAVIRIKVQLSGGTLLSNYTNNLNSGACPIKFNLVKAAASDGIYVRGVRIRSNWADDLYRGYFDNAHTGPDGSGGNLDLAQFNLNLPHGLLSSFSAYYSNANAANLWNGALGLNIGNEGDWPFFRCFAYINEQFRAFSKKPQNGGVQKDFFTIITGAGSNLGSNLALWRPIYEDQSRTNAPPPAFQNESIQFGQYPRPDHDFKPRPFYFTGGPTYSNTPTGANGNPAYFNCCDDANGNPFAGMLFAGDAIPAELKNHTGFLELGLSITGWNGANSVTTANPSGTYGATTLGGTSDSDDYATYTARFQIASRGVTAANKQTAETCYPQDKPASEWVPYFSYPSVFAGAQPYNAWPLIENGQNGLRATLYNDLKSDSSIPSSLSYSQLSSFVPSPIPLYDSSKQYSVGSWVKYTSGCCSSYYYYCFPPDPKHVIPPAAGTPPANSSPGCSCGTGPFYWQPSMPSLADYFRFEDQPVTPWEIREETWDGIAWGAKGIIYNPMGSDAGGNVGLCGNNFEDNINSGFSDISHGEPTNSSPLFSEFPGWNFLPPDRLIPFATTANHDPSTTFPDRYVMNQAGSKCWVPALSDLKVYPNHNGNSPTGTILIDAGTQLTATNTNGVNMIDEYIEAVQNYAGVNTGTTYWPDASFKVPDVNLTTNYGSAAGPWFATTINDSSQLVTANTATQDGLPGVSDWLAFDRTLDGDFPGHSVHAYASPWYYHAPLFYPGGWIVAPITHIPTYYGMKDRSDGVKRSTADIAPIAQELKTLQWVTAFNYADFVSAEAQINSGNHPALTSDQTWASGQVLNSNGNAYIYSKDGPHPSGEPMFPLTIDTSFQVDQQTPFAAPNATAIPFTHHSGNFDNGTTSPLYYNVGIFHDPNDAGDPVDQDAIYVTIANRRTWPINYNYNPNGSIASVQQFDPTAPNNSIEYLGAIDARIVDLVLKPNWTDFQGNTVNWSSSGVQYYTITNLRTGKTFVDKASSPTDYELELDPGEGTLLRIAPATSLELGRTPYAGMAYNNGHRIAKIGPKGSTADYGVVWEQNGKIMFCRTQNEAQDPIGISGTGLYAPQVVYDPGTDHTQDGHNPSIASVSQYAFDHNPDARPGEVAIVFSVDDFTNDQTKGTRKVMFAKSDPSSNYATWTTATLATALPYLTPRVHDITGNVGENSFNLVTPVITPACEGYLVAYTSGATTVTALEVLDSGGVNTVLLPSKATDQFRMCSIASYDQTKLDPPHEPPGYVGYSYERFYFAWEADHPDGSSDIDFTYVDHPLATTTYNKFLTTQVSFGACKNIHPMIAVEPNNSANFAVPGITWEVPVPGQATRSILREMLGWYYPMNVWGDLTSFQPFASDGKNNVNVPQPQLRYEDILCNGSASVIKEEIYQDTFVHQEFLSRCKTSSPGVSPVWNGMTKLKDYAQFGNVSLPYECDVPPDLGVLTYRGTVADENGLYAAQVVTSPGTPAEMQAPSELIKELKVMPLSVAEQCAVPIYLHLTGGGSVIQPPPNPTGNWINPVWQHQPLGTFQEYAIDDSENGITQVSWPLTQDTVRTNYFAVSSGDTLEMDRVLVVDTTQLSLVLESPSNYFSYKMVVKDSATGEITQVIDSAVIYGRNPGSGNYSCPGLDPGDTTITGQGYHIYAPLVPTPSGTAYVTVIATKDSATQGQLVQEELYSTGISFPEATDTSGGAGYKKASPTALGSPQQQDLVVTVHPNPVKGTVKVCVEDLPAQIQVTVDVVNEMGTQIATLYNATPEAELGLCLQLDCSKLPSGIYYADLQTQGQHKAVQFTIEH